MILPLVFHPDVDEDIKEAFRWYEKQRRGLGDDFVKAVEEVLDRIRKTPKLHQLVYKDLRRGIPLRFPYGVYYRVHVDRVEIVAVYHARRDPRGWQSRA
jgi:plasmid stabilization system protein ParE